VDASHRLALLNASEVVSQEPSEMTGTRNSLVQSWRYFKSRPPTVPKAEARASQATITLAICERHSRK